MGKSARILGREFGKTAQGMNKLLKEHGYLEGDPGAYGVTEKGKQYAQEKHEHRGPGGYSWYNADYETRTWNDQTAAALAADMAANPTPSGRPATGEPEAPAASLGTPFNEDEDEDEQPDTRHRTGGGRRQPELDPAAQLLAGLIIAGATIAAPHVKPLWNNKVKPAAKRFRDDTVKPGVQKVQDRIASWKSGGPDDSAR